MNFYGQKGHLQLQILSSYIPIPLPSLSLSFFLSFRLPFPLSPSLFLPLLFLLPRSLSLSRSLSSSPSHSLPGINVPRRRFLPVKKTSDLLVVMSNLFELQRGILIMNPRRSYPALPVVKLGDIHFMRVREQPSRFSYSTMICTVLLCAITSTSLVM